MRSGSVVRVTSFVEDAETIQTCIIVRCVGEEIYSSVIFYRKYFSPSVTFYSVFKIQRPLESEFKKPCNGDSRCQAQDIN